MKEVTPEQREKTAKFLIVTAEQMQGAIKKLGEEFAKTPEGVEAVFLKSIVENYIDKPEVFLERFISSKEGERGIDRLIDGLQHPDSKIKPDADLIKELKSLAAEMKGKKLPDLEEWQHHNALDKDTISLGPAADIHEFLKSFNALLVRATERPYDATEVAITLKARDIKKTPRTIELENYELAFYIWKLMLSRLLLPNQIPNFENKIGRLDAGVIKQAIKERLDSNPALHVKGSGDFFKELDACLPDKPEVGNWDNLRKFATNIDSNFVLAFLRKIGQGTKVDYVRKPFGKKGEALDQLGTITRIGTIIQKMHQDKGKVELAAKDELAKLVSDMVAKMRSDLEKEREKFSKVLNGRVEKLKEEHAQKLKILEGMYKDIESKMLRISYAVTAAADIATYCRDLEQKREAYVNKLPAVLAMMRARTLFMDFIAGFSKPEEFNAEIDRILSRATDRSVTEVANGLKQIASDMLKTGLGGESFKARYGSWIAAIDTNIGKLVESIKTGLEKIDDARIENIEKEERIEHYADEQMQEGERTVFTGRRELTRREINID